MSPPKRAAVNVKVPVTSPLLIVAPSREISPEPPVVVSGSYLYAAPVEGTVPSVVPPPCLNTWAIMNLPVGTPGQPPCTKVFKSDC